MLGLDKGMQRLLPVYQEQQRLELAKGLILRGSLLVLGVSIVLSVFGVALSEMLQGFGMFQGHPLTLVLFLIPVIAMGYLFQQVVNSLHSPVIASLSIRVLPPVFILMFTWIWVSLPHGFSEGDAVINIGLGWIASLIVLLFVVGRSIWPRYAGLSSEHEIGVWVRMTLATLKVRYTMASYRG